MNALLTPDLLIAVALAAVMAIGVAAVVVTPSGAWPRYVRGRRYHRAGLARHTRCDDDAATVTMPAVETVPDKPVSPFAARTA